MSNILTLYDGIDALTIRQDTERFPRLKTMNKNVATNNLRKIVGEAAVITGRQQEIESLALTTGILYAQLLDKYPSITMAEIITAIRKGCFGEFGEIYNLSASTLFKMVESYIQGEEMQTTLRTIRENKEAAARKDYETTAAFLERFKDYAQAIANRK